MAKAKLALTPGRAVRGALVFLFHARFALAFFGFLFARVIVRFDLSLPEAKIAEMQKRLAFVRAAITVLAQYRSVQYCFPPPFFFCLCFRSFFRSCSRERFCPCDSAKTTRLPVRFTVRHGVCSVSVCSPHCVHCAEVHSCCAIGPLCPRRADDAFWATKSLSFDFLMHCRDDTDRMLISTPRFTLRL